MLSVLVFQLARSKDEDSKEEMTEPVVVNSFLETAEESWISRWTPQLIFPTDEFPCTTLHDALS